MCGGTTVVEAPKPSAEESALMSEQAETLRDYSDYQELLLPIQLEQAGYELITDADGNQSIQPIEGYQSLQDTQIELAQAAADLNQQILQGQLSQQEAQQAFMDKQLEIAQSSQESLLDYLNKGPTELEQELSEIGLLQADRLKSALMGELPVAEATTQAYEKDKERLAENLARKLGPDWETSTPGIQAQNELEQRWQVIMDAEKRGEINQGAGLFQSGVGLAGNLNNNTFQQRLSTSGYNTSGLTNMSSPYNPGALGNISAGYQGVLGGYSQSYQPYQYYSGLGLEADMFNAEQKNQATAGLWGGLGNIAGMALGGPLGGMLGGALFGGGSAAAGGAAGLGGAATLSPVNESSAYWI